MISGSTFLLAAVPNQMFGLTFFRCTSKLKKET